MRVYLLFLLFSMGLALHSTQIVFINNIPYADSTDANDFAKHLFTQLNTILEEDFTYQYTTFAQAATMLDEGLDVLVFPYAKPRHMSNRIMLSDTLFVAQHMVFYNSAKMPNIALKNIADIREYLVGSAVGYKYEQSLRRLGLTILYSSSNVESLQRLIAGEVDLVVEDRLQGMKYLQGVHGGSVVKYSDVVAFSDVYFAIVPVKNANAVALLNRINDLIRGGTVQEIIEGYFSIKLEEE